MATRIIAAREGTTGLPVEPIPDTPPVQWPKKSYGQVWPAYNMAQTTEKAHFRDLLFDLCRQIQGPQPKPGRGKQPMPLRDAIFAAAYKIYSMSSGRRFMTDLNEAHERGYLSRPVSYNSIFKCLENPAVTPILHELIVQSSLPLRTVETDFAPDSSGLTTCRFARWYDHKYGCTRQEHDWIKVHLMCGVKTNIVTAVEIHGRDAADSPQFIPLLNTTTKNFQVNEVPADKAYSTVANLQAVVDCGGTPYIPFKCTATGESGGLWEKMLHFFLFKQDEFLPRYHKRSNVESTFSAIKGKFMDSLRSKTDVAMVNEVLCKILCHNICVVIQEMHELGIEAIFWPEESCPHEEELAYILRFPG